MRDEIAFARHVNLPSALTSEIRHAANIRDICHFPTLLNSAILRRSALELGMLSKERGRSRTRGELFTHHAKENPS
jgi:hypothetical protein